MFVIETRDILVKPLYIDVCLDENYT
jgi:hypothetical protein